MNNTAKFMITSIILALIIWIWNLPWDTDGPHRLFNNGTIVKIGSCTEDFCAVSIKLDDGRTITNLIHGGAMLYARVHRNTMSGSFKY